MRTTIVAAALLAAGAVGGCGGGGAPTPIPMPAPTPAPTPLPLDGDYADRFVGQWEGSATTTMNGRAQTVAGVQPITRTGVNQLAVGEMCQGVDGVATLDSRTSFGMDPLACPTPLSEACGPVTIAYKTVSGRLTPAGLEITAAATATGCGQSAEVSVVFTGTRPAMPPELRVVSTGVTAIAGIPLALDASQSADPNGKPLQFAWRIATQPSGGDAALGQAETATPTFTATLVGTYAVEVTATTTRGDSATRRVSVFVEPPGLWRPAAGPTPASGNYVYLQSDPGEWLGRGIVAAYAPPDAVLTVSATGGLLRVGVNAPQAWSGEFQAMGAPAQLQPGYSGNLQRWDPDGGLSWSGEGRGCNTLSGWFVVDAVAYAGSQLTAIDLRFAQHCEGNERALHGQLHWSAQ